MLDALTAADREDELSTWLSRHNVDREWVIAPPLVAAGVDIAWCERAAEVLDGPALGPGLEWVASTYSAKTLLAEKGYAGHLSYEAPNPALWERSAFEVAREGVEAMRALIARAVPRSAVS